MLNSKYNRGILTPVHDNGRGRAHWDYVNPQAKIAEVLEPCFFDLANRGRKNNPMLRPGHLIDIDAADACVQIRVMSMGVDNEGITVRPMYDVVYFDDDVDFGLEVADGDAKGEKKRRPGRPTNAEREAAEKAALADAT